jgi:hypothetical protein
MKIVQVIGWILFSSVKFFLAPSAVYISGYSYAETIIITIIGGALGVYGFYYGGSAFFAWFSNRFSSSSSKPKKVFNKKNRIIIRVKNTYGLFGLAVLTPCLLSIPIGSVLAAKYYRHDRCTIPAFLTAVVFWSFVLTTITSSFGPISWSEILSF